MHQWVKQYYEREPDWRPYAARRLEHYAQLKPLKQLELTVSSVLDMFQTVTGQAFDTRNEQLLYRLGAPQVNPVSAASSTYRNILLFNAIRNAWESGKDVFTLYGSGHAIVLENAVKKLVDTD